MGLSCKGKQANLAEENESIIEQMCFPMRVFFERIWFIFELTRRVLMQEKRKKRFISI